MRDPEFNTALKSRPAVVCTTRDEDCDALDTRLSRSWLRLGVAAVFAGQGMVFGLAVNITPPAFGTPAYWLVHAALALSAVLVLVFLGGPLLRATWRMLLDRRLSIEGLFTLSVAGAFIGSVAGTFTGTGGVYYEVVAIVVAVYTIGRMVSERSRSKLMTESERLRERFDEVLLVDGDRAVPMPLAEITAGSRVRVLPGSPFTVDGIILEGTGYVAETALTGEPFPLVRRPGEPVRAGTWSIDGSFDLRAVKVLGEREIDRILDGLETAPERPSELQAQANDLVRGFLPLVAGVSVATAIYWGFMGVWTDAVLNSMAVLLVACPCALGLATPVAVWQGLFRLAQAGLVSRNGELIDALARTRHLFFDKTGTLSQSQLMLSDFVVAPAWQSRRDLLVASLQAVEVQVPHPVARAFVRRFADDPALDLPVTVSGLRLLPGQGVKADIEAGAGRECFSLSVGERSLLPEAVRTEAEALLAEAGEPEAKAVFVTVDGALAAVAVLRERFRDGLGGLFESLASLGVRCTVLTGDPKPQLAVPPEVRVEAGLSSAGKELRLRRSLDAGEFPVFVGDGINDAAGLKAAAASIAMGGGAGLAKSAADGELRGGNLAVIPVALRQARATRRHIRGNLLYALAYNSVGMVLAATGFLHPVAAALIMLLSSFFVTARALRARPAVGERVRDKQG